MTTATPPLTARPIDPPWRPDRARIMGDLPTFFEKQLDFWLETGRIAPVVDLRFAHRTSYLVTDAEHMGRILIKNHRNYRRDQRLMKIFETGGDKVMFTTEGNEWLWRRRLMQPAFHRKQIAQFCDTIIAETERLLDGWQPGEQVDIDKAMKHLTMMVIGKTMFNVDMAGDSAELHHAYNRLGEFIVKRAQSFIHMPIWMPTKRMREFHETTATISNAINTIIESRRTSTEPHGDLLDMLLSAKLEDSGQTFTEQQLIFEMSSIVFAGHETTATTLTWLLYLLTQHPDVEQRLLDELDSVLEGRTPTMADLANLPYLNQVIDETLRLYPSASILTRETVEDDMLGDYRVEGKRQVFINIVGIQRDERYWKNPNAFDPDRFSAENRKTHTKNAFLPFLIGPRKCIGEPLSRVEMQLIVATLLQRIRLTYPANTPITPEAAFVLQPSERILATVRERS